MVDLDDNKDDGWATVPKKKKTPCKSGAKNCNGNKSKERYNNPYIEVIAPTKSSESNVGTEQRHHDQQHHYEPFMILLVGLPGSGKSTFSESLVASMPEKFYRINQDKLKSRPKCERKLKEVLSVSPSQVQEQDQQHRRQRLCPIIDRCNFDAMQRSTWYRLAKEAVGQRVSSPLTLTMTNVVSEDGDSPSSKQEEESPQIAATMTTIESALEGTNLSSSSSSSPATMTTTTTTTATSSSSLTTKGIPVDVVVLDLPYEECLRRCQLRKGHETIKSPHQAQKVLKQLRREWSPPHYKKNADEKSSFRSLTIVRTEKERKECLLRILNQTN